MLEAGLDRVHLEVANGASEAQISSGSRAHSAPTKMVPPPNKQSNLAWWDRLNSISQRDTPISRSQKSQPGSGSSRSLSVASSGSSRSSKKSFEAAQKSCTNQGLSRVGNQRWPHSIGYFSAPTFAKQRSRRSKGFKCTIIDYFTPSKPVGRLAKAAAAAKATKSASSPAPTTPIGSFVGKLARAQPSSKPSVNSRRSDTTQINSARLSSQSRNLGATKGRAASKGKGSVKGSGFWPESTVHLVGREIAKWLKSLAN